MEEKILLPERLFFDEQRINLYCLHEMFKGIAAIVRQRLISQEGIDITITSGMWGGSYLVAEKDGRARTNVVRLYNIINLPQDSELDDPKKFDNFVQIYYQTYQEVFKPHGLALVKKITRAAIHDKSLEHTIPLNVDQVSVYRILYDAIHNHLSLLSFGFFLRLTGNNDQSDQYHKELFNPFLNHVYSFIGSESLTIK